jgi:nicotinamide-nucleotide amidase
VTESSRASDERSASSGVVWTPANVVTVVRIALIPVLVVMMLVPWGTHDMRCWVDAALFALISLTDSLDGYLARSRDEITTFGKFMDPIADKLLVISAMVAMVQLGTLPSWVPIVIVAREFLVSGLRMIAASAGVVVAASYIGKAKTLFTMVALVMFFVKDVSLFAGAARLVDGLSWLLMAIAVVLTIVSMVDYFRKCSGLLFGEPHRTSSSREVPEVGRPLATGSSPESRQPSDSIPGESPSRPVTSEHLYELASRVVTTAGKKGLRVGTAESLTGGLISATLTRVPGSSAVVAGGVTSYMVDVKERALSVSGSTIDRFGVVSEQTASEMARGAISALGVDVAVAVTGVAGPSGGTPETPVGTVCLCVCDVSGSSNVVRRQFAGGRDEVRAKTVECALSMLIDDISMMG